MKFILQKYRGLNWNFEPINYANGEFAYLVYKTKYGNVYGIFTNLDMFKPIWIARFINGKWINWEHEVRPTILFAYDDNNNLMWKHSWK